MSYAERIAQELQDRAMPIGETDGLHRITAEADAEIAALRARVEALEALLRECRPWLETQYTSAERLEAEIDALLEQKP